ncbi:putative nuclease HARBI1 [Eupeodes corollae]|uniref:putative nuclease HARBI1 n=1 Tax=Eupeodes corollae TaxID=290404 RepID=UPI0024935F7A|nr:putative nuclease HARBI1 [Eupeodes corollae]
MFKRIQLNTWDDLDFLHRFRLSKRTTMMVLEEIKDSLPCDERRSRELRPITQLLIALRYYALGSSQLAIADFSGVCITSVHVVLKRVSRALAELSPRYIQMPQTQNERLKAAKEFFAVAKFPWTIGAIDCTHIRIQSPGGTDA